MVYKLFHCQIIVNFFHVVGVGGRVCGVVGGTPSQVSGGGGYHSQVWMVGGILFWGEGTQGTPWPGLDGGEYPIPGGYPVRSWQWG